MLKESIRTSRTVNAMTDFQFRLWTYLITYVDDYGRGSADPELLKAFVFPRRKGVTESTIAKTLSELATIGSIVLYEVDGESYLYFPNWSDHQRIQQKKSKFPEPAENNRHTPMPTVTHGDSPWLTVARRESPPETETKTETKTETELEKEEEEDARAREDLDSPWFRFVKEYEQNIGGIPANGYALEAIQGFFDVLGPEVMSEAIKATALQHAQNPHRYLQAICQEWVKREVRTIDQARAAMMDHDRRGRGGKHKHFEPPSLEEVQEYISSMGYSIDAQAFMDYYAAVGWKANGAPLEDWRAKIRTWASRGAQFTPKSNSGAAHGVLERDYSEKDSASVFFDVEAEYAPEES